MDYAATTPLNTKVLDAMKTYFHDIYGNPSSINIFGHEARQAIQDSRNIIADLLNAESNEIIFTGSATEANNMVIKGFAFKYGKKKTHIAISKIEHDSVYKSVKWLEKHGFKVSYIPVDKYGLLDLGAMENILKKGVTLVSVIHGNNEIGTIQSLKNIGEICHKYDALFHTDAAQTFGKIPIDVKKMKVDFMTINAHKIYGPKGVGTLFLKKDTEIEPLLHGGGHEFGLRSGTENVPGIVGFAKSVELRKIEMNTEAQRLNKLGNRLIKQILKIDEAYLNGHPKQRLVNILNFRFSYIEGEALVLLLNDKDIATSTGSACSSRKGEPSRVLLSLGLRPEEIHGSLRLSLGKFNTKNDIDYLLKVLPAIIKKLRLTSPLTR
jgi:cysteine desulfurase